jgi:hypothetical protein
MSHEGNDAKAERDFEMAREDEARDFHGLIKWLVEGAAKKAEG